MCVHGGGGLISPLLLSNLFSPHFFTTQPKKFFLWLHVRETEKKRKKRERGEQTEEKFGMLA